MSPLSQAFCFEILVLKQCIKILPEFKIIATSRTGYQSGMLLDLIFRMLGGNFRDAGGISMVLKSDRRQEKGQRLKNACNDYWFCRDVRALCPSMSDLWLGCRVDEEVA